MNPFVFLPFLALFALPHPHVPKAIVMHGAGGKAATLTWFTVPYNPDKVKALPNGQTWHLGFAMLEVERAMQCGDVVIPPASYKLNALHDDKGEFSELQLEPIEIGRARPRNGGEPDPERLAEIRKDLKQRGIPELVHLPTLKFEEGDAEHLEFMIVNRGYETVGRFTSEPKGGASFTLMATFGDLHRRVDLAEVFEAKAEKKD